MAYHYLLPTQHIKGSLLKRKEPTSKFFGLDNCEFELHIAEMLRGKVGVVVGISNHKSIGWSIAKNWQAAGADVHLFIQNDRFRSSVEKLTSGWTNPPTIVACDVTNEDQIKDAFEAVSAKTNGLCHAVAHSVAFATAHGMRSPLLECTLEDYRVAHEVSAYSLISVARHAVPHLKTSGGGSIVAMSFEGSSRVVPEYRIMASAKASLESLVKYLAVELGLHQIRVNSISPGPVDTISARGIQNFTALRENTTKRAPMTYSQDDVGNLATALASDGCKGITGQNIIVDGGASILM